MCIKAIANFDYEAAKDNLVETVKYLDAGKILGVAGKLLEINPKDVVQKIKDKVTDEDTRLFVQSKVRLVGDILTWPISMISSFTRYTKKDRRGEQCSPLRSFFGTGKVATSGTGTPIPYKRPLAAAES